MPTIQHRVDSVVDGFDEVRSRQKPTNGECLAIFIVLAADILAESEDGAELLYPPVEKVLKTRGLDSVALKALFDRCGLPAPRRKARR